MGPRSISCSMALSRPGAQHAGTPSNRLSSPSLRQVRITGANPFSSRPTYVCTCSGLVATVFVYVDRTRRIRRIRRGSGIRASIDESPSNLDVSPTQLETDLAKLETISANMELAGRVEDYEEAARLRDRLRYEEAKMPVVALLWRQRKQTQNALEVALFVPGEPLDHRLGAIRSLGELARPPASAMGAEDALHRVLKEASGPDAADIQAAAEKALWKCWCSTGDEDMEVLMKCGVDLMERGQLRAAEAKFTELIDKYPEYGEGWNKRATVRYSLKKYDDSIMDSKEVLKRKPRHFGCLSGLGLCYYRKDDTSEALRWFKRALEVHPGTKSRNLVEQMEVQRILQKRMAPHVSLVKEALESEKDIPLQSSDRMVCSWDVHRMSTDQKDQAQVYFFRVTIQNRESNACSLKSLARYYALKFTNGKVFAFTRPTQNESQFILQPGEEYKFCWALIVRGTLKQMAGGALMAQVRDSASLDSRACAQGCMEPLLPMCAPEVPMQAAERLGEGYNYTGQLDLRKLAGL